MQRIALVLSLAVLAACAGTTSQPEASAAHHFYWTNRSSIGRANLDGSAASPSFIAGLGWPCGLALDHSHIYWAESGDSGFPTAIGRANVDGTGVNQSFITGAASPSGIAIQQP